MMHATAIIDVGHLWNAGAQADDAAAGREMCGQSAGEDDDKGKMEHEDGQTLIQPLLQHICQSDNCEHTPQR